MSKQTNEMPVRYKKLNGCSPNDFKWERSLDLVFTPGTFTVEIDHTHVNVGLPIDFCGKEHYIVGTLIVTDSGNAGRTQKERAIGQVLMFTDRESKETKIYTRTFVNGEWSEWRSFVYAGMFDKISTTDELLATVTSIVNKTKKIEANLIYGIIQAIEANKVQILTTNDNGGVRDILEIPAATAESAGVMSAVDKRGLEYIKAQGDYNSNKIVNVYKASIAKGNLSSSHTITLAQGEYYVYIKVEDAARLDGVNLTIKGIGTWDFGKKFSIEKGNIANQKITVSTDGEYNLLVSKSSSYEESIDVIITTQPINFLLQENALQRVGALINNYALGMQWKQATTDGGNNLVYSETSIAAYCGFEGTYNISFNTEYRIRKRRGSSVEVLQSGMMVEFLPTDAIMINKVGSEAITPSEIENVDLVIAKPVKANVKEISFTLESGSFNAGGGNEEGSTTIRTEKIATDGQGVAIVTAPKTLGIQCNFLNYAKSKRTNLSFLIMGGVSVISPKEFVRFGFRKYDPNNEGSYLPNTEITEEEKAAIKIYYVKNDGGDYDVVVGHVNGKTQGADIVVDDENAQYVITALLSCLGSIRIKILQGNYLFNDVFTTRFGKSCLAKTQDVVSWDVSERIVVHGDCYRTSIFTMSDSAFAALPDDVESSFVLVPKLSADIISATSQKIEVEFKNIAVRGYDYTKPYVTLDLTESRATFVESVYVRNDLLEVLNGAATLHTHRTRPHEGNVGIRVGHGSNQGIDNAIKRTRATFCGKGISCCGEHYVFEDVLTHHCYIGWAFGDRATQAGFEHPNVMIGCSIEGCYRTMLLTKQGIMEEQDFPSPAPYNVYRSTLVAIGTSTETNWHVPTDELEEGETERNEKTKPVLEIIKGAYRGRIELDGYTIPFEEGSGEKILWTTYSSKVCRGRGATMVEEI